MSKPTLKATFNIFKSYAIHPIKLMHKQERKKRMYMCFKNKNLQEKEQERIFYHHNLLHNMSYAFGIVN